MVAGAYQIWYGEDLPSLRGSSQGDNAGTACVDVYAMDGATLQQQQNDCLAVRMDGTAVSDYVYSEDTSARAGT
eukprot:COSAG05_NODE_1923_length_3830_cov_4.180113_2_plen_74_part_00